MEKIYQEILKKKSYVIPSGVAFLALLVISFLFGRMGIPLISPLLVLITNLSFLGLLGSLYLNVFTLLLKDGGSLTEARFTTITQLVGTMPYIFWNSTEKMKENYVADIKFLDDMVINDVKKRNEFVEKMLQRIEFHFEGTSKTTSTTYEVLRNTMMENFITTRHLSYGELREVCSEKLDKMLTLKSVGEYQEYNKYFALIGLAPTDLNVLTNIVVYSDRELETKVVVQTLHEELKYLKKYYKEMNVDKLYEEFHNDNPNETNTSSLSNNLVFKGNQHILFRAKYQILDTTSKPTQIRPYADTEEYEILNTEELEQMYSKQKQVIDEKRAKNVAENVLLHDNVTEDDANL